MSLTGRMAKNLSNYENKASYGSRLRRKRITPLLKMIDLVFQEKGSVMIADLGGTETYWNILPEAYFNQRNVMITIINLPGTVIGKDHGPFRFVEGDACNLEGYENNTFDITHSNSVIEHVGNWDRMVNFAKEASRIAERYYVQTPNFWFPIEPHFMTPFFHWLPKTARKWLVRHFQLGNWPKATSKDEATRTVKSSSLLSKRQLRKLFPDATIIKERVFGLSKSFISIKK